MKAYRFILPIVCVLLLSACRAGNDGAAEPMPIAGETAAPTESMPPASEELIEQEETYLAMAADGEHPQLIAHAGGAVFGYRLTNSLEALNSAYQSGFRYIELDMSLTADGHIVLIHDWADMAERMLFSQGVKTREEFLQSEILADLTLLDIDGLAAWLADHPDCSIVTDIKEEANCEVLSAIRERVEPDIFGQFIPQVYTYEEYREVQELGFDRIILTLYRLDTDADELSAFAEEFSPWAITVPEGRINEELLDAVTAHGVAVYAHTVNSLDFFETWTALGLTGIYTDYFVPCRWIY